MNLKETAPIKIVLLYVGMFAISLFASNELFRLIVNDNVFFPSTASLLLITELLFGLMCVYSLTFGAWAQKLIYFVPTTAIPLGASLVLFLHDPLLGIIFLFLGITIVLIDLTIMIRTKDLLRKPNPRIIFGGSGKRVLAVFSVLAALFVIATYTPESLENLGATIAEKTAEPTKNLLQTTIEDLPINQFEKMIFQQSLRTFDIQALIQVKTDQLVTQYKEFMMPITIIIAFFLIQFLAVVIDLLFSLLVILLFKIATLTKFFHTSSIRLPVEVYSLDKRFDQMDLNEYK